MENTKVSITIFEFYCKTFLRFWKYSLPGIEFVDRSFLGNLLEIVNMTQFSQQQKLVLFFSDQPRRPAPDFKTLLHCDTASECPGNLAQCNSMLNPTYLGKSGYCVPQSCRTNRECPTVGDECGDGSISGTCNSGNCQYDPVLAAANCGNIIFLY